MEYGETLIAIGGLLLAGLALDYVGRRTGIPRVSLLVTMGVLVGPAVGNLIPETLHETTDFVATLALVMVAFLLGSDLALPKLREHGRQIITISGIVVIVTALAILGGLLLAGIAIIPALLLAAIGTATDPAATRDVVQETGRSKFSDKLLGIVAIDDAWGLIVFGIAAAIAGAVGAGIELSLVLDALWELGGAILLGALIGFPAAYLTGRIRPGSPSLVEGLGIVLTTGGLAILLDVSYLLAAVSAGTIVVNFARHHERSFREIENIDQPIMVLFFILAGASLDIDCVIAAGAAGAAYAVARVIGRIVGGWLGGILSGMGARDSVWMGASLMPQAGVAIGMALVAAQEFPAYGDTIIAVTIGATVLFELLGPIVTHVALTRTNARTQAEE